MFISLWFILTGAAIGLTIPLSATPISKYAGKVKTGSYIVKLKPGVPKAAHLQDLSNKLKLNVTYSYVYAFYGYAAILDAKSLEYVRQSNEVEAIYEDAILHINQENNPQPTADSIDESTNVSWNKRAGGSSVDIYVVDTGIYTQHTEFGGRASWGATFGGYADADGNGHGTYLAGVAGGATSGIAPQAKLYSVKVASDSGSGSLSDFVKGLDWVTAAAKSSGRPSILLTAFASSAYSTAFDNAVQNAINSGVHFLAAAGSSGAGTPTSPRVTNAIIVGAIDSAGRKTPSSNYAQGMVYYYGVSIQGPWIGSTTAVNTISGTTASVAGVAGILAKVIDTHGNEAPAALRSDLLNHTRPGTGAPTPVLIAQPW